MNSNPTYRITASALVLVFTVFSVGLPLVVASCPMPKSDGSSLCEMCYSDMLRGTVNVTTERDASCCVTKIAAERNTTEFLQTQQMLEKAKAVHTIISVSVPRDLEPSVVTMRCAGSRGSPPSSRDIPILHSSLLI